MYKWVTTRWAVSYPATPQFSQSSSSSPFSSSEFLSHLQIFSMETMVMSLSPIYLLFSLLTAVSCCCASNTLPSISSTSLPCSLRRCLVYARQRSVSIRNLSCKIGYICNLPLWTFHMSNQTDLVHYSKAECLKIYGNACSNQWNHVSYFTKMCVTISIFAKLCSISSLSYKRVHTGILYCEVTATCNLHTINRAVS